MAQVPPQKVHEVRALPVLRQWFKPGRTLMRHVVDLHLTHERNDGLRGGAYGLVAFGTLRAQPGKKVAVKQIQLENLPIIVQRNMRELILLSRLRHPNIIKFIGAYCDENFARASHFVIVMSAMDTTLHAALREPGNKVLFQNPFNQIEIMHQLLSALQYLQRCHIIHRDLKTDNLLINLADVHVKLCDFGLGRYTDEEASHYTSYVVTRFYRAPEVMLSVGNYNGSIDIWAAGCIFGELLSRRYLFLGANSKDQVKLILSALGYPSHRPQLFVDYFRGHLPPEEWRSCKAQDLRACIEDLSPAPKDPLLEEYRATAHDLLLRMLKIVPDERISVDDALRHAYFSRLRIPADEELLQADLQELGGHVAEPIPVDEDLFPQAPEHCPSKMEFYKRAIYDRCEHIAVAHAGAPPAAMAVGPQPGIHAKNLACP